MKKKISSPVVRTDAPPLKFISVIPAFAGREAYLAQLISERYERTGITEYAMCYSLHPQGEDVMVKPAILAKSFHGLKALLKDKTEEEGEDGMGTSAGRRLERAEIQLQRKARRLGIDAEPVCCRVFRFQN